MRRLVLSFLLAAALCTPAEAAQVVTKDGRHFEGAVRVEAGSLQVAGKDGQVTAVPYDEVQAVSLDDQPAEATPRGAEQSRYLNNDWLVWTAVAANVATIALAVATLIKGTR